MKPIFVFLLLCLSFFASNAQNCGCSSCDFPIPATFERTLSLEVNGATFNDLSTAQQGVCEVTIDFAHDFLSDLSMTLSAPNGQTVELVQDHLNNDTTYFSRWKIKYLPCSTLPVPDPGFQAPFNNNSNWPGNNTFSGSYFPATGCLEDFNAGSVNGVWTLTVLSNGYRGVGFVYGFSIKFCQEAGLNCEVAETVFGPGDDCEDANYLPVDSSSTYIGSTVGFTPSVVNDFCGSIENDQWFKFISICDTVKFRLTPSNCTDTNGVQIAIYENCSASSPLSCQFGGMGCVCPLDLRGIITPGAIYYLLIDGFQGDSCDFELTIPPGCINQSVYPLIKPAIVDSSLIGCKGSNQTLELKEIPFTAAGYIWKASNGNLVNGQAQVTIPGPINTAVQLTYSDQNGEICVAAYNFTDTTEFVCLPILADTNLFLVENALVCSNDFPYRSTYEKFGVPDISVPGAYSFMLQNYLDDDGHLYACPVKLELNITSDGGFYTRPTVVVLGSQYTLPNGNIITTSGVTFWSDTLASGCVNINTQGVYFIKMLQNGDSCAPDTVTFTLPGSGVSLECPGGSPALINGLGNKKVVYQNSGIYDLIGKVGNQTFLFEDTLKLNLNPAPVADFTSSINQNVLSVNNLTQNATSYLWTFGDGATSTLQNPTHTYALPGNYVVKLKATGPCPSNTVSKTITIAGQLPVANFQVSSATGCVPFVAQYNDQSLGSPTSWLWEFPGGSPATSTLQNPSVTYASAGVYGASLTIQNVFGQNVATQSSAVTVIPLPEAFFSVNLNLNQIVLSNLSVNATSYSWDFGNGVTSTDAAPTYVYNLPGQYTITLTATNLCGSSTSTKTLVIAGLAPLVAFQVLEQEGCIPFEVHYQDQSTGNPTAWSWQFPGGAPSTSTIQNPVITYLNAGTYDATLVAQNAFGGNTLVELGIVNAISKPVAAFTSTTNGLQVIFSNQTQGAISYTWDFGDNSISTEANPTHAYTSPGTYVVVLQASNACGNSIVQKSITIISSGTGSPGVLAWLSISPNPSNGHFQLELQDKPSPYLAWRLFNSLGQKVAQHELAEFRGYYAEKLNFEHLPPAMYWLEVRTGEKRSWLKLIKE